MRKATSKKQTKQTRKTELGQSLVRAAEEMAAHVRGEIALPVRYVKTISDVNVIAVRKKLGLSQSEFAGQFRINLRSLQDWEQGRREPESAVRAYLKVIEH